MAIVIEQLCWMVSWRRQHIDDAIADQCTSNEPGTKSNTSKLREFRFKYFSVGFMVLRGEYVQPTW
jgi:hypothetical protein